MHEDHYTSGCTTSHGFKKQRDTLSVTLSVLLPEILRNSHYLRSHLYALRSRALSTVESSQFHIITVPGTLNPPATVSDNTTIFRWTLPTSIRSSFRSSVWSNSAHASSILMDPFNFVPRFSPPVRVQQRLEGQRVASSSLEYDRTSRSSDTAAESMDSIRRMSLREANRIHCRATRERTRERERLLREVIDLTQ